MSAPTALYRRYRPDSFADVIGQEHVTAPLMAALDKDRVNHAYLFSGPRGCGKTTSARILARCLNCAQGPTSHPCGTCDSCVELARGGSGSLDVIEIDAASHGGVDDARDLRERATFAPIRDRYKIFIIDEAHMVTSAGFNALLKIVEEPPEHIKFIFATTEPDKVIGTIRSRTHHYPFRLVPPEPLMAYLARLSEQENVPVAPGVLSLVIRAGGGSVRDSLSVLDQLMAGAGAAGLDYELAVDLLGYTHSSLLDDVVEALAASDAATVFKSVDRVIQTGHDPRRFVEDLLERFRDLIIVQAMPESAHAILRGTPDELIARMQTQAAQLGASELSRAADVTNAAFNEMTGATSPRLHLELLGARLLLPGADSSTRGMAARLDAMERRLNYGGAPAGADASGGQAMAATFAGGQPPAAATAPLGPPSRAVAPPVAPGGGLAAVRAQLAKAKADAGAEVASRHQDSTPETTGHGALPSSAVGVPAVAAPAVASPGVEQTPASPQPPTAPEPNRVPTWDDLEQPAAPAPAIPVGTSAATPAEDPVPAPERQPQAAEASPSAPGPGSGGGTGIEVIRRAWPEILSNLSNIRKASWAMVNQNVVPRAFDGETLRVALPTTALIQTFGNSGHADNLRQAIHTTLGITCQLDPITGDAPNPGSSAEPNPKGLADPRLTGNAGGLQTVTAPDAPNTPSAPPVPRPSTQSPMAQGPSAQSPSVQEPSAQGPSTQNLDRAPDQGSALNSTLEPAPMATSPKATNETGQSRNALPSGVQSRPVTTTGEGQAAAQQRPVAASPEVPTAPEWDGPIPEEPNWDDEPPFDDWAEPAQPQTGQSASANDWPSATAAPANNRPQVMSRSPEPSRQAPADEATTPVPESAPAQPPVAQGNEVPAEVPEAAKAPEPYRPKVSSISAWTTGWDMPADKPAATTEQPAAAEAPATPRRSQLLAAQTRHSAESGSSQDSPQDWGVSLGGPSRNNVADPGWGAPANAPDWAMPDSSPTDDSATSGVPAAPSQEGGQAVSVETSSSVAPEAPAAAAGEKLSMYQRLSNSAEAQAGRTRVPSPSADTPLVEDVPSEDDVTIEESGVAGQAAVERILGGQLVEEKPLSGSSY